MNRICDAELCKPLVGVNVVKFGADGAELYREVSDKKGRFSVSEGQRIVFTKQGYIPKEYTGKVPPLVRLLNDRLIGYQDKLWFIPGQEVNVYIHSSSEFNVKLFRYGLEKRCVLDLGKYQLCTQTVEDKYFVENGLSWQKSLSYKIPDNAVAGLYGLQLENDIGEKFSIPFIVSTLNCQAKVLVLASTNTWQSYNIWGGRSRYRSFEDNVYIEGTNIRNFLVALVKNKVPAGIKNFLRKLFPKQTKSPDWMFKRLSIKRPFTNCDLETDDVYEPFCNHLAAGEWRLLAWLEQQKIAYDIVSGAQAHYDPELFKKYKAVILSTHCEYWSRKMYDGLKNAYEQGTWIMNLSGNSIFRLIEVFDNGDTRCIDLSFKNGYEDETKLLGVRFSLDDYGTCAPYKIVKPDHWVFKGINVNDDVFGRKSLNCNVVQDNLYYNPGRPGLRNGLLGDGSSGWETDKLVKDASSDFVVIACGTNKFGGADMVVKDNCGQGGGVFSASSIVFGASLLIDDVASKIVNNVISKAVNK